MSGLEAVLGRPEFKIPCEKLIRAQGAIVYAWVRDGRVLYIGMSASGPIRPLSASHDVCWAFQPGDHLFVWKAKHREEARRLERLAIDLVGAAYNGPGSEQRPQRPDSDEDDPLFEEADDAAPRAPSARNLTLFGDGAPSACR